MVRTCFLRRQFFSKSNFRNKHCRTVLAAQDKCSSAKASTVADVSAELSTAKPFEEMPGVPILPFIGSGWAYLPIIGKYSISKMHIADRQKFEQYGNAVREKLGPYNIVSSFVPETMEQFFRHEGPYPYRIELFSLKAYRESRKQWFKTLGIILLQGKEWYDLRSKVQKHLMKPKAIQAYLQPMQAVAKDMVALIRHKKDENNEVPGFLEDLHKWALESVAFVGLDTRLGCLDINLTPESDGMKMINSVQTQIHCIYQLEFIKLWKYVSTPTWRKYTKATDVFTEIAFKYINRSLEALKNADEDKELTLLQSMLLTKDLDVTGAMVTVGDMLMAGIDTTSHTVGFLLYHLARNPDKQNILFHEINRLLPKKKDRMTGEVFANLQYLKACLKESIRLDPIVRGNVRIFDHDVVISGYRVPAGTLVMCVQQVASRNAKYFKDPDSFIPERWLDKGNKQGHAYSYTPFGIGPRSCIGRRLAELEMISLTSEIIRNFKVEYHYEDLGMITKMINVPDKPLRFTFVER